MNGYLKMLRIEDWIKFYMIAPLAGAILAGASPAQLLFISVIYISLIGYAFVVNNYFDVEIDRLHEGKMVDDKNPLARGSVSTRGVLGLMAFQITIALLYARRMDDMGTVLVTFNALLFTAYSIRVLRLKERPVLDIATHGLMFGALPLLAGFILAGGLLTWKAILVAALAFVVACEALIAHQVVDYDVDVSSTRTTVTRIGQRRGIMLLGVSALISILTLVAISRYYDAPSWMAAALGWYLLAYPVYSCRGIFRDICYRAIAE